MTPCDVLLGAMVIACVALFGSLSFAAGRDLAKHLEATLKVWHVLECEEVTSKWGVCLRVQIERFDGAAMPWREVYDVFQAHYPGKFALQVFPPREKLMDQTNKYHLFVFDAADWPAEIQL